MIVQFTTRPDDFPPNLEQPTIDQHALYFARAEQASFEVAVADRAFTETGAPTGATAIAGGPATTSGGLISTLTGNAGNWGNSFIGLGPTGVWELALQDTPELRGHLSAEEITDMLFVLTYRGHTPDWPA